MPNEPVAAGLNVDQNTKNIESAEELSLKELPNELIIAQFA